MAGVDIKYKGSSIASIQGTGSKTLKTGGQYCEGDIIVDYVKEGITPSGTINISTNGTVDVTAYASASVNVPAPVQLSKTWILTLQADSALGASVLVAADDSWLNAHKDDLSLTITIAPLFTVTEAVKTFYMSIHSNRIICGSRYGRSVRSANASTSLGDNNYGKAIKDMPSTGSGGGFFFDGTALKFCVADGGGGQILPAGSWLVTASISGS